MKKGSKTPLEIKLKLRPLHRGSNHYNWKGGKISLIRRLRRLAEYWEWNKKVRERDFNRCIRCSSITSLHVDHIISLKTLLNEFLYVYNQFSPEDDKETLIRLALKWKKFWDIDNGRTLCLDCHRDR